MIFAIRKICEMCNKLHTEVPDNARPQMGFIDETQIFGYFWECQCGSTLFKKVGQNVRDDIQSNDGTSAS